MEKRFPYSQPSNNCWKRLREYSLDMAEKVTGPKSYFPSIEAKYGKPISFWMKELKKVKGEKHMVQVAFLKDEHGMGQGHANAIVHVFRAENE
jgi:hypothetical protein